MNIRNTEESKGRFSPAPDDCSEVENIFQEGPAPLLAISAMVIFITARRCCLRCRCRGLRWRCGRGAFYDLVQLAAIEPYAPAFGAIVDFDTLPVRHDKGRSIHRAFHRVNSVFKLPSWQVIRHAGIAMAFEKPIARIR